jgi:hypothetical protein
MNDYLAELTKVVRQRHGQEAQHMLTVLVNDIAEGNYVWDITVEVFGLRWNPRARRCYAWGQPKAEGGWDIITVLEIRPVVSPQSAVKAALARQMKSV